MGLCGFQLNSMCGSSLQADSILGVGILQLVNNFSILGISGISGGVMTRGKERRVGF